MNAIRHRLGLHDDHEGGLSLIEVVVAMMIFAIISTGAMYTMLSVLQVTRGSRTAQVAANLAAQEIDLTRDIDDLFDLVDVIDRQVDLNGDTFFVTRRTQWVSDPGLDLRCGSGGAPLRYKRVNVSVRWENMREGTDPITSDTVIDPKNRINDPTLGTILVSVLNGAGTGSSGVTVTAAPVTPSAAANGATPLTVAPRATDAQGCTYVLKVTPGNYNVKISRTGFVDAVTQAAIGTTVVGVAAGGAASVGFEYDRSAAFTVRYATHFTTRTPNVPNNLDTTFLSTYGAHTNSVIGSTARTRTLNLYPYTAGYQAFAGKYVPVAENTNGCLSPNPTAWEPIKRSGDWFVAPPPPTLAAAAGGATTGDVPMGVVTLSTGVLSLLGGRDVKAVSAVAPGTAEDPGCVTPMTYTFESILPALGGQTSIALPYGSWKIFTGGPGSQNDLFSALTPETNGAVRSGVLTLDPRTVLTADPSDDDDDDDDDDD